MPALLAALGLLAAPALHAVTALEIWAKRYNGTGNSADFAYAVATDAAGNVVVTGYSAGAGSGYDCYTAKYARATGALIWEKRYNGPILGTDQGKAVAVDSAGNVFVTGVTKNAGGHDDYYTAKYAAADGALIWEKFYDGPGANQDIASALAVDASGNVIVTGYSTGSGSGSDMYTAKYAAANGALLWEKRYNGPGNTGDQGNAIALDGAGNVIVTGASAGSGSVGDYYTAKYAASNGALIWEQRYNGPDNATDSPYSIAVDSAGNVVVTGESYVVGDTTDYCTVKYAAANGALLWTKRYNGPGNLWDTALDVAIDSADNVIVTGSSFGSGGSNDYYTAKYAAANGALLWEKRYNGPGSGDDTARGVALDSVGNAVVTGWSLGSANLDYYTAMYAAADGALIWEKRYNGPGNGADIGFALAVDRTDDSMIVAGYSDGSGTSLDYATVKYATEHPIVTLPFTTNLNASTATLNATVNPNGHATTAQFEYGLTTSYGNTASVTLSPNNGTGIQNVSANITGLTVGVAYHYRFTATNAEGTMVTQDGTFTPINTPFIVVEQPSGSALTDGVGSVNFDNAPVTPAGRLLTFTVRNTGNLTLTNFAVSLDGPAAPDYTFDATNLPSTLAAGNSATFTVAFRPLLGGTRTAALHITSNDGPRSPFDVALTGTGSGSGTVIYAENFDSGSAPGFTFPLQDLYSISPTNLWHVTANYPSSGAFALGFVKGESASTIPFGNYDLGLVGPGSGIDQSAYTPSFSLPAATTSTVTFKVFVGDDYYWFPEDDNILVYVTNGANQRLGLLASSSRFDYTKLIHKWNGPGTQQYYTTSANLSEYAGQTVRLEFNFKTYNGAENSEPGARIDDIVVATAEPITREVLASKGGAVPGAGVNPAIPAGAVWASFGVPSINGAGQVVTVADWKVGTAATKAVIDHSPTTGDLEIIIKRGVSAPGAGSGTMPAGAVVAGFKDPLLANDGAVALIASLANAKSQTGITSANNQAIYLDADGGGAAGAQLVAHKGAEAVGVAGSQWKTFASVALGERALAFTGTMVQGPGGVTMANDFGLWVFNRNASTMTLALREGDSLLGSTVKTIAAFVPRTGSPGQGHGVEGATTGQTVVRVALTDGRGGVGIVDEYGGVNLRYVKNDFAYAYTYVIPPMFGAGLWKSFGLPTQNSAGAMAFTGTVATTSGITAANNVALFAEDDTTFELKRLVTKDDDVPENPYAGFSAFKDPVNGLNKSIAFHGTFKGSEVYPFNDQGIYWRDAGGKLTPVAKEYGVALGAWPSATVPAPISDAMPRWKSFTSLALPEGAMGPMFIAKLQTQDFSFFPAQPPGPGGVTTVDDVGLWAVDSSGTLRLLLREGDTIGASTVKSFKVIGAVSGSSGQTRSFNNNAEVIVHVTDVANAQHLMKITIP